MKYFDGKLKYPFEGIFFILIAGALIFAVVSCRERPGQPAAGQSARPYYDTSFFQEYHEAFKVGDGQGDNEVRSIAVAEDSSVWIATASGPFMKEPGSSKWERVITGEERGPSYSVISAEGGDMLIGTWNGLYRHHNGETIKEEGPEAPVSELCTGRNGAYALGPHGIWHFSSGSWQKEDYKIARSVRDAHCDSSGVLWIGTDAGLYRCSNGSARLFQDTTELISCYVRAVAEDNSGRIWAGVLGGISIRKDDRLSRNLTPGEGIPSVWVNCISKSPDGVMWAGTDAGIVRINADWSHSLRFTRRWLTDNKVLDIDFDRQGSAWIATANGVSMIGRRSMTLEDKERNFYSQLMKRHIREPWTCGVARLEVPGDTASWTPSDDDNDGEYTGGYLAMESFRYAATHDSDALIKAGRAFRFLRFLHEVTGTEGFFARSVVPVSWKRVNDPNRTYSEKELAEELVNDPRYKPVGERWRRSKDGKWLWKGDTSSDEMDGHMMGYFYYYELAAGEEEKKLVREHVTKLIDCLMKTGYDLVDIDGTHTRWSVWSPGKLNHDPDWASEKSLNSLELLTYLKFAAHITGDEKYEKEYRRLIDQEGYLENAAHLNSKNPAWQIYFDRTLEGYILPILIRYEMDPVLASFYRKLADEWMSQQSAGENLINNFSYAFATGKPVNVPQSMDFLRDAPLDLVDWPVDHTIREDVKLTRNPILEEIQVAELPPASERSTVRWDKNPWAAVQGNPTQVREPVFWLWPYWMARYLDIIRPGKVRIGICADAHLGTMHDSESRLGAFLDEMKKARPDFMIELGDFAEASDSVFFASWDACPVKGYHVIGNHETDGGHTLAEALSIRKMTKSFYSFDAQGYHFIVLDGNEKSPSGKKGYSQYIGEKQLEWFRKDLLSAGGPVIIFSHQPLLRRKGAVETYGVENADALALIISDHNRSRPESRVLACINGHNHWDYAEKVDGVWYISITSMSYHWLGEEYQEVRYGKEVDRMFRWIKYTAPFRDPLYTTVEISRDGFIRIRGKRSGWVGSSPFELGYPERMKEYLRPEISERTLVSD